MTRVKRGVAAHKRRKYFLKRTKGFTNRRSTNAIAAKEALLHADSYTYAHRRLRKRDLRKLWTIRTNAASREHGMTFSKLMGSLRKQQIGINKKMLAELAVRHPEVFEKIVASVK
ncbi:MAG: 50S ribosomal protein L20 [Candidatus Doudnabacteria bacterium RIFCSPLOWO2_02_FULL_49_13]|uniref:Large ribosomal subunit protein bL20 n=1 Tax=Candidatus Doudnabacteria bacterium RIFCSPHIGHO2_12_FULL_48_16 TaxID=1817838 RepID=A0A1F5PLJ5_9BACT|nr:MAG: 50S ribosomal protein L20 [Candidatus Doudnabacteria bacterium RIFCSPHIGHO2_02_FULL_49_24]OGE90749.1 MAG: 50S ribosomal protein L20 [Candidatus Doudnabacteria bacterium RIFCSPHIGHO2_12_FULL_48_16]OGE97329.1 MAG: 50S ribosomal protein L20 [Candidatus Doudnabacteria bacterium RIFCSPLOWO2_01_FULL_49_40]OGF02612.1 MAG: 50S ribosomal protein L20 [Candidatus Doudnabacteria bacterium RIFCSPLOWO2_02_FULL_49_13]OGF03638.1 MAG: 50S ribosomal protein L20 [Candidatus Doudnabacteria bacterium RIFCSP